MKANLAPNKKKISKKEEKKQTYALFATLLDLTTEFDDMLKNSEIW
jgi:phosphorylcholine metabolism protein LicD